MLLFWCSYNCKLHIFLAELKKHFFFFSFTGIFHSTTGLLIFFGNLLLFWGHFLCQWMRVHVSQSYCSHLPFLLPSPSPVPFPVSVFIAAAERQIISPPLLCYLTLVSSPLRCQMFHYVWHLNQCCSLLCLAFPSIFLYLVFCPVFFSLSIFCLTFVFCLPRADPPAPLRSASCSTVILSSLHAVPRQPCLPPSLPYVCHFPQGTPSKINSFPPWFPASDLCIWV